MRKLILALSLFIITILIYKLIYPDPRNWYDHFMYLAHALMNGRVNVINLPLFYQDTIQLNNQTFLPFPPAPAFVIIPFLSIVPQVTEQQISIIIGSLDIALIFLLLNKFTDLKRAYILSIFTGFGTALFWASIVGTTWYFAHVVAFFFLILSLICHFSKKDILSGILFSLAVLSRYPILLGCIFYVLQLQNERKRFLKFFLAAASLVPIQLIYNYLRFGSIFETGYYQVYLKYIEGGPAYSIIKLIAPNLPPFGYLDPRNIPLHLFTFLIEPPIITSNLHITPSPFGMGIIFTTPLLFLALRPNLKNKLERNLFLGATAIAFIDFLHYAQGWVQFGYRFLLDFLPFLLIILATRFKLNKLNVVLLIIGIAVNFWGVYWAINLGW